jgi:hypothetical protein
MSTGYKASRATVHDAAVRLVVAWLQVGGYKAEILETDGHRPDILVPREFYVDVKTVYQEHRDTGCFTLESNSAQAYDDTELPVWICVVCWPEFELWGQVRTRLGPKFEPTGNGSTDTWHRVPRKAGERKKLHRAETAG